MLVTVAICTWNRSVLLCQALEQMTRLAIPAGVDWELLVVNNNSTDATDEVIATFVSRLPVRRLFEPQPGQSHARNAAVREARGDYIVWTDDDVLVDEHWVAAYVRAFETWPDAAFFGGPVQPWFVVPPPAWLTRVWPHVAGAYAERDLGAQPVRFKGGDHVPYGANFATRVKEQCGYLYNPKLGLKPGSDIRSEETTLMKTLLADGHEGWWVPDAVVQHYIPPERMTTRYLRRWFEGYGEQRALQGTPWTGPILFGKPRWFWRRVVAAEARYRLHRLTSPPEIWIMDLIDVSMVWGAVLANRS